MPASPEALAPRHAAVLRALWQLAPTLTLLPASTAPPRPVLVTTPQPAMHLPRGKATLQAAAVAHMAAHLAHGGPPVARGRLKPIQLALLGALEDARVEQQALRALPGLLTLWRPWHLATPQDGHSFEALLQRLQRRLLDPHYQDPHPWIHKAWQLVQQAEPGPAGQRQVASLLGHDVGQMRLPFNASTVAVGPAYRDDNHHLWLPDPHAVPSQTVLDHHAAAHQASTGHAGDTTGAASAAPAQAGPTARHPEWDRLIGRLRPQWCSVHEIEPPAADPRPLGDLLAAQAPLQRRLLRAVQAGSRPLARQQRADDGPAFHLPSLVQAAVHQRLRRPPDPRVHQAARPQAEAQHILVLLDSSASTGDAAPPAWGAGLTLLQALSGAAWLSVRAWAQAGHQPALMAFRSQGRHQVELLRLHDFDAPLHAPCHAPDRLAGLQPQGSTRLGAAVRHACWRLQGRARPQVLLLTDGEPHDVDVFDRRYLLDDLRQAVLAARRRGIHVGCLVAGAAPSPALRRAFSPGACQALHGWQALPGQLLQALAQR